MSIFGFALWYDSNLAIEKTLIQNIGMEKFLAALLIFFSILWSFANLLLIFQNKTINFKRKILWLTLSFVPIVLFIIKTIIAVFDHFQSYDSE